MKRILLLATAAIAIQAGLIAQKGWALGAEDFGNEPLSELNYAPWKGIMTVVNDKARVYQRWVNGNERLWYQGKTKDASAALAQFVKVEVEHHVVVLRPGPAAGLSFQKKEVPHNWELHVLGGLAAERATDDINDLEWQKDPVLTIFIGGDIELEKLEIPMNATLRSVPVNLDGESKEKKELQQKIAEFVRKWNRGSDK